MLSALRARPALIGLREAGNLQPGQKVLVIGAAAGVGTYAELIGLVANERQEDLLTLKGLIEAGKLTPVLDRTYPLSEAADAIRYLEQGHARGKVVLTISA